MQSSDEERGPILTRPKTRTECRHGLRPCPWVSCRYHLYLDVVVTEVDGVPEARIVRNRPPGCELVEPTCALDIAEDGEHSDAELAALLGTTEDDIQATLKSARARLPLFR